MDIFSIIL
ncbi:hypothetical protein JD844_017856 [Phrynosoma platyrhinos]|uniref:Uncharacterized protein n=1 Tax=Phrynosoma platyrhinos TaxID=52577 RepID=A0ABQ7SMG3_PHRPL|nr:hypothetical protein JD844_017856 [Phrynosoma platyrhinos]